MAPTITIGMPTFNDYDGVYFTIQALRTYHDICNIELLVVDNYGCDRTKVFVEEWVKGKYVLYKDKVGTAAAKNQVFANATGDVVLCIDCHVLLWPGAIQRLRRFVEQGVDNNLYHGPLLYDNMTTIATHMNPKWRGQMWGTWAHDARGMDTGGFPFQIWGHGTGLLLCQKRAWAGFNDKMSGFGGEEGYIQEKFRWRGDKVFCLPWLRWIHRFGIESRAGRPVTNEDKFKNYIIGHDELGLPLEPVFLNFLECIKSDELCNLASSVLGKKVSMQVKVSTE